MVSDYGIICTRKLQTCLNPCSIGIWSLTRGWPWGDEGSKEVLILVLMEYGLWPRREPTASWAAGLNPCSNGIWSLTLMYGSRRSSKRRSLNPCSNGIWSLTGGMGKGVPAVGLNPCSNGIWSLTQSWAESLRAQLVLILVLMEYGLWPSVHAHRTGQAGS